MYIDQDETQLTAPNVRKKLEENGTPARFGEQPHMVRDFSDAAAHRHYYIGPSMFFVLILGLLSWLGVATDKLSSMPFIGGSVIIAVVLGLVFSGISYILAQKGTLVSWILLLAILAAGAWYFIHSNLI